MGTARIALIVLLLMSGCSQAWFAERTPPASPAADRADPQAGGAGGM
ncbi:MAG: hypothetical protein ACREM3_06325 [Candidatus Rokuibacteriota bacterium]